VVVRAEERVRNELIRRQQDLNVPLPTYVDLIEVLPASRAVTSPYANVELSGMVFVLVFAISTGVAYAWQRLRGPGRSATDTDPGGPDVATEPGDGAEFERATSTDPEYHRDPAQPATVAPRGSSDEAR
jgi:hypothetical protein